jgi:glycosyltransferase involved in cell wall biosynthesis
MVSVIIPYIDEFQFLQDAMASVVAQQEVETEIILVCNDKDFSGDELPFEAPPHRFLHEKVAGSAHARNAGLREATGEWVQFLDVDDLLLAKKLFHQVEVTNADVVVSPHLYRFQNGKEEKSKWLHDDLWVGLLNSGLGSTSSMLWRRQALLEVNGWNTNYHSHQEYELLFRLMVTGKKIATLDYSDTIVRQRKSGSITQNSLPVRWREGIRLREDIWQFICNQQLETPERKNAFHQYLFRQLRGLYRQDRKAALSIYRQYFTQENFRPVGIHVPGYASLYRLLGFRNTERLLEVFVKLRDR